MACGEGAAQSGRPLIGAVWGQFRRCREGGDVTRKVDGLRQCSLTPLLGCAVRGMPDNGPI